MPSVIITMSVVPRPAPARHSARAAQFASLSIAAGRPNVSAAHPRTSTPASGMLTEKTAVPDRWSIADGMPIPTAATDSSRTDSTAPARPASSDSVESTGVGRRSTQTTVPSRSTTPTTIFVPPTSTPIVRSPAIARDDSSPPVDAQRLPGDGLH